MKPRKTSPAACLMRQKTFNRARPDLAGPTQFKPHAPALAPIELLIPEVVSERFATMSAPAPGQKVYTFKYLVGRDTKAKTLVVGVTPTYKYHADISKGWSSSQPFTGGLVSFPLDADGKEVYSQPMLHGFSEGFRVYPHPRDAQMLSQLMVDGCEVFTYAGKPITD